MGSAAVATGRLTPYELRSRYLQLFPRVFIATGTEITARVKATELKPVDIEMLARRYPGRRGIRKVGPVVDLIDSGSQSPRETWLRLLLVRAGFPRPQTQIPVYDATGYPFAVLDMGWEDIKVAAEYDGDHHRTDRRQYRRDIERHEELRDAGWHVIRVTAEDTPLSIVRRVRDARGRRQ